MEDRRQQFKAQNGASHLRTQTTHKKPVTTRQRMNFVKIAKSIKIFCLQSNLNNKSLEHSTFKPVVQVIAMNYWVEKTGTVHEVARRSLCTQSCQSVSRKMLSTPDRNTAEDTENKRAVEEKDLK